MDSRTQTINRVVQSFDRTLFVYRNKEGMRLIMRRADRLEDSDYNQKEPALASLHPQMILALTDSWKSTGQSVDWGIEPILEQLKSMDLWRNDRMLEEIRERRESKERDESRMKRNEFKAIAADMRRDFAKATNDINTSTLEKVDHRRKKDGSRK